MEQRRFDPVFVLGAGIIIAEITAIWVDSRLRAYPKTIMDRL